MEQVANYWLEATPASSVISVRGQIPLYWNVWVDADWADQLAQFQNQHPGFVDQAECLNQFWFLTFDDARAQMEEWRRDYNEVHFHSDIGNKPPISLMNGSGASCPP